MSTHFPPEEPWQRWLTQSRQQAVRFVKNLAGLTACSQQITLENGERYVLRRQSQRASEVGANYQNERHFLSQIAPLALAPKPLYADSHSLLLEWIDGQVPSEFSPSLLQKLGEQLARLHQFSPAATQATPDFARLCLAERCQFLWQQLSPTEQQSLPFAPPFPAIKPLAEAICHHDIHLGNLVEQGEKLYLIDWEYAAISDPALDLALFLHANSLSGAQQADFFATYFAKSSLDPTACFAKIAEYTPEVVKLTQLWFMIAEKR